MDEQAINKFRNETKGCKEVIHFNNAGSSLPPDPVYNAVVTHLELERCIGGYEAKAQSQEKVNSFYTTFAKLFNCRTEEIAFVENATRAWDMVFYSIPFESGDRILTAQTEYASNYLAFLQIARKYNVKIDVVPDNELGEVSVQALEEMIDEKVKLIAITHTPSHNGLINPAKEVGKIARKYNILFLLDACQSVGQMPIDVKEIGCDMLSGTGRKFLRGPRGTGFLFVKESVIEKLHPPFIDLHAATWIDENNYSIRNDAKRFENWESYVAGKIGLATAAEYALKIGLADINKRICFLAELLRNSLTLNPKITVLDRGKKKSGIVTFIKQDETPSELYARLAEKKINVSISSASYARIDMGKNKLDEVVRASVHYYNTEEEIGIFSNSL